MKSKNLIFLTLLVASWTVQADVISIIDVHRNIPLADEDPVYKDFAINSGESAGLKKNLVVTVKRKVSVKDSSAKSFGEMETIVGQIKIIQVDKKIAIGREYKLQARDDDMSLDQIGIMTGDHIDLTGSFIDSKPAVKKKIREPSSQAAARAEDSELDHPENNSLEKSKVNETPQIRANPLALPDI